MALNADSYRIARINFARIQAAGDSLQIDPDESASRRPADSRVKADFRGPSFD
jgi:hypothetical protein